MIYQQITLIMFVHSLLNSSDTSIYIVINSFKLLASLAIVYDISDNNSYKTTQCKCILCIPSSYNIIVQNDINYLFKSTVIFILFGEKHKDPYGPKWTDIYSDLNFLKLTLLYGSGYSYIPFGSTKHNARCLINFLRSSKFIISNIQLWLT